MTLRGEFHGSCIDPARNGEASYANPNGAIDAAVKATNGNVANRAGVLAALKKADFTSVRGPFTYGINNFPIQPYYLRVIEKNANGQITNKLVGKVFDSYQDVYVGLCKK